MATSSGFSKRSRATLDNSSTVVQIYGISDDEILPPRKRRKSSTPDDSRVVQITTAKARHGESRVHIAQRASIKNDDNFFRSSFEKLTFDTGAQVADVNNVSNGRKTTHESRTEASPSRPSETKDKSTKFPVSEVIRFSPYVDVQTYDGQSTAQKENGRLFRQKVNGVKPSSLSSSSTVPPSRPQPEPKASKTRETVSTDRNVSPETGNAQQQTFSIEIPVRLGSQDQNQQKPRYGTPPSGIQVVIPSPRRAILNEFRGPVPSSSEIKAERKALLSELKLSTKPAIERLGEVERLFGTNGFSKAFPTEPDENGVHKKAAPTRKREVNRTKVVLDRGDTQNLGRGLEIPSEVVHPANQVKKLLSDRFRKSTSDNLTFVNNVNDRRLNGKFQVVDQYILRDGVRQADPARNYGCDCRGRCVASSCLCLNRDVKDKKSQTVRTEQLRTYIQLPNELVVLSDEYLRNELDPEAMHFEITECNEFCGCGPDCWNRVVSRGRTVPLEIFETEKCGFGVRSSVNIHKGQFVEVYLGEVITERELVRREEAKDDSAPSYIYSLDWFNNQYCYHVDGERFGTAMRFVNHSCEPNAKTFTVQTHKNDKNVYFLAFFAIRDIAAGTEITIDYSPWEAGETTDEIQEDEDGRALCFCGAPTCRRFLWRDGSRKRKRRKARRNSD